MATELKLMAGYGGRLLLACIGLWLGCMPAQSGQTGAVNLPPASTPGEATYLIDGQSLTLRDGEIVVEQIGDAAAKNVVRIFGEPVRGDLDGDGVADAVLLLVQTRGGSGTFYYLAAAFDRGGAFVGSEAVFLGDRIAPQQLVIRHGLVVVDYADRLADQAMTVPASLKLTKYLVSRGDRLEEVMLAEGEGLFAGEVVIGHEVRRFTPCGDEHDSWLTGASPALPTIKAAYQQATVDPSDYALLFMVLLGRPVERPADGFGANYTAGFYATRLVLSRSGFTCSDPVPPPARFQGVRQRVFTCWEIDDSQL